METTFQKEALYAGSFDPITIGHEWVIEKAMEMFDHMHIGIAVNSVKSSFFSLSDRVDMVERLIKDKGWDDRVSVLTIETKYAVSVMKEKGIKWLVRGIRNTVDFEYENNLININQTISNQIEHNIETVYLIPPKALSDVSSSVVRGLVGFEGWETLVKNYVSESIYHQLLKKRLVDMYDIPESVSSDLNEYLSSWRGYHNIEHIYDMFMELEVYESSINFKYDKETLIWAILYHDIVYDTQVSDSENVNKSCEYVLKKYGLFINGIDMSASFRLIRSTDYSKGKRNLLTDLDLSVLGKPWEVYEKYTKGVRKEYSWVDDKPFHEGRLKILENLLTQKLFHKQYFIEKFEEQAKANIRREIEILKNLLA